MSERQNLLKKINYKIKKILFLSLGKNFIKKKDIIGLYIQEDMKLFKKLLN